MHYKTLEIIYELQHKRKPSFINYITSYKSIIVFAITFFVSNSFGYTIGFFVLIIYFWWDLPRTMLVHSMKITNTKNVKYFLNVLAKQYYTQNSILELRQIITNKLLKGK